MALTYAELRQEIQDYTENDETSFVNNIPSFIERAEQRVYYWVQLPLFRANATGTTTVGNRYLTLPDDFKAPLSLRVVDGEYLINKDVSFIREAFPGSVQSAPRYYGLFDDDTIIMGPIPDQAYSVELHYSYEPASLTAAGDDGTTWLSENAQDALLYASLVQAYTYMKGEEDIIKNYDSQFSLAINRLKNLGEARNRKDVYRGGELRAPES
jgi:hypothetical protein